MSVLDYSHMRVIYNLLIPLLVFSSLFGYFSAKALDVVAHGNRSIKAPDFSIAAFLSLHQSNKNTCGTIRDRGIYFPQALSYAVNDVNRDGQLLGNFTLSLQIKDTCNNPEMSLSHALHVVNRVVEQNAGDTKDTYVLGVISDRSLKDSSHLMSLFGIPQIDIETAQLSTQNGLNDLQKVDAILKGFYKSKALSDIIKYFSWSSVSVVFSETFHQEATVLKNLANTYHDCLAVFESMNIGALSVMQKLVKEASSRVVILYTEAEDTRKLLEVVRRTQRSQTFTWILSGHWNLRITDGFEDALDGSLALKPEYPFLEDFYKFVEYSDHSTALQKPSLQDSICSSNIDEQSNCTLKAEDLQSVVNSVFLFASSLSQILNDEACMTNGGAPCRRHEIPYSNLVKIMGDKLSNISRFGEGQVLKETRYVLFNLQKRGLILKPENVGLWEGRPLINKESIRWKHGVKHIPQSSCGLPCPLGHIRVTITGRECCWYCKPCNYNQFVRNNYTCADCKRGYWPTNDFAKCDFFWGFAIFNSVVYIFFAVSVFIFVAI